MYGRGSLLTLGVTITRPLTLNVVPMKSRIAGLFLWLASTSATACSCVHDRLDVEFAQKSDTAVLFQVVSARLIDDSSKDVVADVEIIGVIRGSADKLKSIRYSTYWCCGTQIDVGNYYIAFGSIKGEQIQVGVGNLLFLFNFDPSNKESELAYYSRMLSGRTPIPGRNIAISRHKLIGVFGCIDRLDSDEFQKQK